MGHEKETDGSGRSVRVYATWKSRTMSDELETNTRVFTLRVWQEQRADGRKKAKWRGHITNVLTGREQYIEDLDLDQILQFILADLEDMNVKIGWPWRLLFWLKQTRKKTILHRKSEKSIVP